MWTPDLETYTNVETELDLLRPHVYVYSNGEVYLNRFGIIKSSISFDLLKYPFDSQIVRVPLVSWTMSKKEVEIKLRNVTGIRFARNFF